MKIKKCSIKFHFASVFSVKRYDARILICYKKKRLSNLFWFHIYSRKRWPNNLVESRIINNLRMHICSWHLLNEDEISVWVCVHEFVCKYNRTKDVNRKEWMKIKFATHSSLLTLNISIRTLELSYDIDKNENLILTHHKYFHYCLMLIWFSMCLQK